MSICALGLAAWLDVTSTAAAIQQGGNEIGGTAALGDAAPLGLLAGKYVLKCHIFPTLGISEDLSWGLIELPSAGAAAWNIGVLVGASGTTGGIAAGIVMIYAIKSRFSHEISYKYTFQEDKRHN
jgi:hypothetical protein